MMLLGCVGDATAAAQVMGVPEDGVYVRSRELGISMRGPVKRWGPA